MKIFSNRIELYTAEKTNKNLLNNSEGTFKHYQALVHVRKLWIRAIEGIAKTIDQAGEVNDAVNFTTIELMISGLNDDNKQKIKNDYWLALAIALQAPQLKEARHGGPSIASTKAVIEKLEEVLKNDLNNDRAISAMNNKALRFIAAHSDYLEYVPSIKEDKGSKGWFKFKHQPVPLSAGQEEPSPSPLTNPNP